MAHSRHLALEDLRLARDPDHLLALFRRLAYRTEPELVPLDPASLEFPDRAGIQRCFLLADQARAGLAALKERYLAAEEKWEWDDLRVQIERRWKPSRSTASPRARWRT